MIDEKALLALARDPRYLAANNHPKVRKLHVIALRPKRKPDSQVRDPFAIRSHLELEEHVSDLELIAGVGTKARRPYNVCPKLKTEVPMLQRLRSILLAIPPAGPDGFEGLVAICLAEVSGLTFRLAKSGAQFGRDARAEADCFAVAMEAKRYERDPGLEKLLGKAMLACQALESSIDLWVLGATCEISEGTLLHLNAALGNSGISFLALDWSENPLPQLAVLITAASEKALGWFRRNHPKLGSGIRSDLESVMADSAYEQQLSRLKGELCVSKVGLSALRQNNTLWAEKIFRDRRCSTSTFGQFLNVLDPESNCVQRTSLIQELADQCEPTTRAGEVIVVLGDEGAGKSWLVAKWWTCQKDRPILLFVSGRWAEHLKPDDSRDCLARILAAQHSESTEAAVSSWHRRLKRWGHEADGKSLKFAIVLDGINEHPSRPWADITLALANEARNLDGVVIVTSRTSFWKREVLLRTEGKLKPVYIRVTNFTDDEVEVMFAARGVPTSGLTSYVRSFLKNPRVCMVALSLVKRLRLTPNELTVDRLLLEYWQARVEERGNLTAHTPDDFHKLLMSHAKRWLHTSKVKFDRDDWVEHSGPARRSDIRTLEKDLTDIEEGRFLQPSPTDSRFYEFRHEGLPFALALLIDSELLECTRDPESLSETLNAILDPIRGFDRVSEVLSAAVGLASTPDRSPEQFAALLRAFLEAQNISKSARESISSYVPACAERFLDGLEWRGERPAHFQELLPTIARMRDFPRVKRAIDERCQRWLGRWSKESADSDLPAIQTSKINSIAENLHSMNRGERIEFDSLTHEEPDNPVLALDFTAAVLLAGKPLAEQSRALFAWALASSVAPDLGNSPKHVNWLVRLNPVDWSETKRQLERVTANVKTTSGDVFRHAASTTLLMSGDLTSALWASELWKSEELGKKVRLVENYCETNPHDPQANPGQNLKVARKEAARVKSMTIWTSLFTTGEDYKLECILPAIARFDFQLIVNCLRRIASTAPRRDPDSLLPFALHAEEISPILTKRELTAIQKAYSRLCSQHTYPAKHDLQQTLNCLLRIVMPHLSAEDQLQAVLLLPQSCNVEWSSFQAAKPIAGKSATAALLRAKLEGDAEKLCRTLLFLGCSELQLCSAGSAIVIESISSSSESVQRAAVRVALHADDKAVDEAAINLLNDMSERSRLEDQLLATAIIRRKRADLYHKIPEAYLGLAGEQVFGAALERLVSHWTTIFNLKGESIVDIPEDILLTVELSNDCLTALKSTEEVIVADIDESALEPLDKLVASIKGVDRDDFVAKQDKRIRKMEQFERTVLAQGCSALLEPPQMRGLAEMVEHHPKIVLRLLTAILDTTEEYTLRRIRNHGLCLASAYAKKDPGKAAVVFQYLSTSTSNFEIKCQDNRLTLFEHLLFAKCQYLEFDRLKINLFDSAFDDATLERATFAAEYSGAGEWLDQYVRSLICIGTPASIARALTVSGFRRAVDRNTPSSLISQWGDGFLGKVAEKARKNYERASWARHWLTSASTADNGVEFWRSAKLAESVLDLRYVFDWQADQDTSGFIKSTAHVWRHRFDRAAEKRTKKRKSSLFGLPAPDAFIVAGLSRENDKAVLEK